MMLTVPVQQRLCIFFLKELGANVDVYIPKRLTEGYGMSIDSIDLLGEQGR